MRTVSCEREREIVEALRRSGLDAELQEHAANCTICSDAAAVSLFLQTELVQKDTAPVLPDSDFVWWKGQLAAKQAAVERATRSIELVRRASYLAISASAVWLIFAPGHLQSIIGALSKYEIWGNHSFGPSALVMAVAAVIFTVLGSFYLARAEK